jgi:hypothetical protein
MVRFAFNPNESSRKKMDVLRAEGSTTAFSALFTPQSITKDDRKKMHRKFFYEKEVLDLLQVIDGSKSDKNILGFLDYDKIKDGKMCQHIVCVLPYRASCDALEHLINKSKKKFKNLNTYEIINIAGLEKNDKYNKIENVKAKIRKCENEDHKKTITLTVNRMLTGCTVPEWDTMLYLKDTASPQEYDQAIFRIQNQYVKESRDESNKIVSKLNMKPQTLLVDFNPDRMFLMQEEKAKIYNVNIDKSGNSNLGERIKRELEISPIIILNHDKMMEVTPTNIIDMVREYSQDRSVVDEAKGIPIDKSLLDDPKIRAEIEKLEKIGSKHGLEIAPAVGEGDEMDLPDGPGGTQKIHESEKTLVNEKNHEESDEDKLVAKFTTYYAKILFFSFLTNFKVKTLEDVINQIDANKDNIRIANNLDLKKNVLVILNKKINKLITPQLDNKINNINDLANDKNLEAAKRVENALKRFGRLSVSEVITPKIVADKIISSLPDDSINKTTILLDIASKQGEFVYAVYKKFGKEVAGNFYSIPTSKIAYEFTRKVYSLLELDINLIEKNYTSY